MPRSIPLFAQKYRLARRLGRGGMGEVWLAVEEGPHKFRRQVALKRLLATNEVSRAAAESFLAEATVISRIDHPNIVRLVELGATDSGVYLALDYVDGSSLDKIYREVGPLPPKVVALIGIEIARALDAVHSVCEPDGKNCGVVHRDVTPGNILIGRDGRVRLTDFGVARISGMGGDRTETGVFKGKLGYTAPEQAMGVPFDGRADIFSLGVTLYEGLLGKRLRRAETPNQLIFLITTTPVPPVHQLVPGAPEKLAAAIDGAIAFAASDRTPDARELITQLAGALRSFGPRAELEARQELRELIAATVQPVPEDVVEEGVALASTPEGKGAGAGTASGATEALTESAALEDDSPETRPVRLLDETGGWRVSLEPPEPRARMDSQQEPRSTARLAAVAGLGLALVIAVGVASWTDSAAPSARATSRPRVALGSAPVVGASRVASTPSSGDPPPVVATPTHTAPSAGEDSMPSPHREATDPQPAPQRPASARPPRGGSLANPPRL